MLPLLGDHGVQRRARRSIRCAARSKSRTRAAASRPSMRRWRSRSSPPTPPRPTPAASLVLLAAAPIAIASNVLRVVILVGLVRVAGPADPRDLPPPAVGHDDVRAVAADHLLAGRAAGGADRPRHDVAALRASRHRAAGAGADPDHPQHLRGRRAISRRADPAGDSVSSPAGTAPRPSAARAGRRPRSRRRTRSSGATDRTSPCSRPARSTPSSSIITRARGRLRPQLLVVRRAARRRPAAVPIHWLSGTDAWAMYVLAYGDDYVTDPIRFELRRAFVSLVSAAAADDAVLRARARPGAG